MLCTASRWEMLDPELARINGKPFPISWGTDQGDLVFSWNGGLLDKDLKDVSVWFDDLPGNATKEGSLQRRRQR
jgi:hypothetical protein